MFCPEGEIIFIHTYQKENVCPSTLILDASKSESLEYFRGDMESLNPKFTLHIHFLYSHGPVHAVLAHRMGIWSNPPKNGLVKQASKMNFVFSENSQ